MRVLVSFALAAFACFAQTQTATVRGVITDKSGAVIPGATVTLTNTDQNRPSRSTTNGQGEYLFVQIPASNYALTIEANGFKKYHQSGIKLDVAQVASLDVVLELGASTETIEVTSQAPLLDTASSTLDAVVDNKTTEALPLNGRNVLQLVALTPGINTTRSSRGAATGSGSIAAAAFSANGGREIANEIMLDGSPQVVMGYNQPAYVPTPDALQEFRVQTNSLAAEYGRTGGAVINLVHRSGTKEFHGVLYEFLRNDKFDANTFFSNRNGREKPPFRFNQFGGTLGGPMTKSRQTTFFFVNYEAVRQVNPGGSTYTVPTAAMKTGDFSAVGTIYDPSTIAASGVRQPFAGNRIPSNRFNPVAMKFLSYYPTPTAGGVVNNYFTQTGGGSKSNNISFKIDRRISERQNLFGRFSWINVDSDTPNYFGNIASPDTGASGARNRSATIDDSYLIGGWVFHANLGYAYHANPRDSISRGFDVGTLGMAPGFKQATQFDIFPRVEPNGYGSLGGNATWIIGNKFETHTWSGDATRLVGAHTIKTGGVYRINRVSNFRPNAPAGLFSFSEGFTRDSINSSSRGGDSIASMMLGLMSGGRVQYEPQLALQVIYGGVYIQDDWRVNERLTLNAGLRWDTDRPLAERYDRTSSFDYSAVLPLQVPGLPPLHGGLVFANKNGAPRGNKDPDNNNFAPRLGLAYKFTPRLVIRSGFGLFYSPTTGNGPSTGSTGAISFNAITNLTSSADGGRSPYTTLSNPFPDGYNKAENGALGLLTQLGQSINAQSRFDRTPYTAQWNFDVQYGLGRDSMLDVAYAGNAGVKLMAQTQLNQLPDKDLTSGDDLNKVVNNPFFGILPATSSIGQRTTTAGQLLRPYPQLTGLQQTWGSLAHSSYHSLQTKFRKRYRSGLQMLAAYTWSKILDDFSSVGGYGQTYPGYTNNNRRDLDKSLSSLNVSHRLAVNFQYDVPFRSQRRILNVVASGWSVNGVVTAQSGMPIPIASLNNTTGSFGGGQRPNSTGITSRTPGTPKDRVDHYFDTAAFLAPPRYTFGNVGRTLPDNFGPGLQVWDISVLKTIPLREKIGLEFRSEFFNAFNNVNFLPPEGNSADFGRAGFGTITDTERARVIQFGLKLRF